MSSRNKTRTVTVRLRGYRTVESVGEILLEVPAHWTNEEVEEALEDMHDVLPHPEEWEDLEDEAEIEVNPQIQPFGVCDAGNQPAQASVWISERGLLS